MLNKILNRTPQKIAEIFILAYIKHRILMAFLVQVSLWPKHD